MDKTHNLIFVNHPSGQDRRDFEEIGVKIEARAPRIATYIVPHDADKDACGLPPDIWTRPTFCVSFQFPERFNPERGTYYVGRPINKAIQIRKYVNAGVRTPETVAYQFGRPLDRSFWGDYVIIKPTRVDLMSFGDAVYLMRTDRAAETASRIFPPDHPARSEPVLIQRFIDTGRHAESFRVLTLFGEPLYCMKYRQREPRPSIAEAGDDLLKIPVASTAHRSYDHLMLKDDEVIEFARKAAKAMPAIPLQGIDVIREVGTGKLFVLECNPGGNTWHFSSEMSAEGRNELSREERMAQFDAWEVAANVLAERVLTEAN